MAPGSPANAMHRPPDQSAWFMGIVQPPSPAPSIGYGDHHDGAATLTVWDNKDENRSRVLSLEFRGDELQAQKF
jgi:hypothetical protein